MSMPPWEKEDVKTQQAKATAKVVQVPTGRLKAGEIAARKHHAASFRASLKLQAAQRLHRSECPGATQQLTLWLIRLCCSSTGRSQCSPLQATDPIDCTTKFAMQRQRLLT